jgi:hypothetical protein
VNPLSVHSTSHIHREVVNEAVEFKITKRFITAFQEWNSLNRDDQDARMSRIPA